MKKLLIALLVVGIAAPAMARYGVYPIMLKGKTLEGAPDKGKFIENGEVVDIFAAAVNSGGTVKGILIDDEDLNLQWIFIAEDGVWEQIEVDLYYYWFNWNFVNEQSSKSGYKWIERGTVSIFLEIDLGDVYLELVMNGPYAYSEQENSSSYAWKYALNANGAGIGEMSDSILESDIGIAVNSARIRYDNNRSHQMSDAYYDVLDEGGGEAEAVAAAEDWLEALLRGESDPDLPLGI